MIRTNLGLSQAGFWLGLTALFWLSLSLAGAGQDEPEGQLQQLLRRFPNADLNKDGRLTRDEVLQFRGKIRAPTSAPAATASPR